jgi:hypothetical protein
MYRLGSSTRCEEEANALAANQTAPLAIPVTILPKPALEPMRAIGTGDSLVELLSCTLEIRFGLLAENFLARDLCVAIARAVARRASPTLGYPRLAALPRTPSSRRLVAASSPAGGTDPRPADRQDNLGTSSFAGITRCGACP